MLTGAITRLGHAVVSGLFRFDVNKLVPAADRSQVSSPLSDWMRLAVANVERMVAWLVLWPAAHLAMVGVSTIIGLKREPTYLVVPVELIPGLMLAWSLPRASLTLRRAEQVSRAVDSAAQLGERPRTGRSGPAGGTGSSKAVTGRSPSWQCSLSC